MPEYSFLSSPWRPFRLCFALREEQSTECKSPFGRGELCGPPHRRLKQILLFSRWSQLRVVSAASPPEGRRPRAPPQPASAPSTQSSRGHVSLPAFISTVYRDDADQSKLKCRSSSENTQRELSSSRRRMMSTWDKVAADYVKGSNEHPEALASTVENSALAAQQQQHPGLFQGPFAAGGWHHMEVSLSNGSAAGKCQEQCVLGPDRPLQFLLWLHRAQPSPDVPPVPGSVYLLQRAPQAA